MSGSYSNLALFPGTTKYVFAWQSRGALNLYTDSWMGAPNTQCSPRWLNHNVAIATLSSKSKLSGAEASSVVGAAEGDTQVNWITKSDTVDHQNVHVATLNSTLSLVTWESLTSPKCQAVPLSCSGTFAGTSFQFVDSAGSKVGAETVDTTVTVSGDMAVVNGKICWPYVDHTWTLSAPRSKGTLTQKMSFACAGVDGAAVTVPLPSSSSTEVASSSLITLSSTVLPTKSTAIAQISVSSALAVTSALEQPSTVALTSVAPSSTADGISPSSIPGTTEVGSAPVSQVPSSTTQLTTTLIIPSSTFSTVFTSPTESVGEDGEIGECEW